MIIEILVPIRLKWFLKYILNSSSNLTEIPFVVLENLLILKFVLWYLEFETGTFKKARLPDVVSFSVV